MLRDTPAASRKQVTLGKCVLNDDATYMEVKKVRRGYTVDAEWVLPGNHGDELHCVYWPARAPTCWDKVEFTRVINAPMIHSGRGG